ncbi:insulinase family protein [Allohahella sp. A8]|uniref:insulinase family protein n=1 Tax=Allohahella sp. A8 TaxID=3141461 RepID=UPI003A803D23
MRKNANQAAVDDAASPATAHFRLISTENIESLNVNLQTWYHEASRCVHYHLASESDENVCLIGLRTVPTDSTGVAHILEHTTLCGSQRYPVRDPFFMMTRRSLNTFMNAFTSADWTAYPFASENRKDFFNLLDVYLDAVFFPTLNELDFAQEGHRIEVAEPSNPESPLVYKGVVYNEMKGAMSSSMSQLWAAVTRHLFPSSTYHHNSGGDPAEITELSYEQLKQFYTTHYHPSNAVIMTFGNLPVEEIQQSLHDNALRHFAAVPDGVAATVSASDGLSRLISIPAEKRYAAPLTAIEHYPCEADEENGLKNKTHIVMGWLLGDGSDLEQNLEAHLLANVLLEHSASPLMQAIETTDLGNSPSGLCGLEDSFREMVFVCGLEGSERSHIEAFEQLVLGVLQDIAENGIDQDKLQSVLHQLELSQREISGDGYPYGLQLILAGLSPALAGINPGSHLDIDEALESLRQKITDPDYICGLVRRLLLENMHRVTVALVPDEQMAARQAAIEAGKLAEINSRLSAEQRQQLIERAEALTARQASVDKPDILPKVGLADVPPNKPMVKPAEALGKSSDKGQLLTAYDQGTNGLVYLQYVSSIPQLGDEELRLLPLLSAIIPELGVGKASYLQMQEAQSASTGGIGAFTQYRGPLDSSAFCGGAFVLGGKALERNGDKLADLMTRTMAECRFDELDRIHELCSQILTRRVERVTGSGHSLAMSLAASGLSASAAVSYKMGGIESIPWLRETIAGFSDRAKLEVFAGKLEQLHQKLLAEPGQLAAIGESAFLQRSQSIVDRFGADLQLGMTGLDLRTVSLEQPIQVQQAWQINSQVNFAAIAVPTVPADHPDNAPLTVIGNLMRNGFLHRAVREQGGAYGGGAAQDASSCAFKFYSYRDPRLNETLQDFARSVDWLLETRIEDAALEEAILGVIGGLDKPRSPAGEGKTAFINALFGRDDDYHARFRSSVLKTGSAELKQVAERYLTAAADAARHSVGLVVGERGASQLDTKRFKLRKL